MACAHIRVRSAAAAARSVVGARSIEQLEDNLGATGWSLTEEQVSVLTDASPLPTVYPYQLLNQFRQMQKMLKQLGRIPQGAAGVGAGKPPANWPFPMG